MLPGETLEPPGWVTAGEGSRGSPDVELGQVRGQLGWQSCSRYLGKCCWKTVAGGKMKEEPRELEGKAGGKK